MKFKQLSGDINWQEFGGKFVSKKLNNGDFDYWLVLDVINMHEATGDESQDKYYVSLLAISPSQVSQKEKDSAISSCGWDADNYNDLAMVEILSSYGIFACLWQDSSNNITQLMKDARHEAELSSMLFGFYMDRQENRIGQNGWDLIRGQDIREFLNLE